MHTMTEIDRLAKVYSENRTALRDQVQNLNDQINALKKAALPGIRKSVGKTANSEADLRAAVKETPELFRKPKTVIMYGIKVGWQKAKGKLLWADDQVVVKAIKKKFGEDGAPYIKTVEKPLKKALEQLSGAVLKSLGITVNEDTDEVVISSTDSDIDKLVNALLKPEEQDQKETD
ncbi:MAG: hypothetical protein RDU76_11460 [Candidatus Edwardsbacteria bacterium]|nr:hypothetical protein [Candidatus Edwardsbacteria bacterium]